MRLVLSISIFCLYTGCYPQNRDTERSELLSVVELPRDLKPIEETNEWYPNGDGYYLARFLFEDKKSLKDIKSQLLAISNINELPFGDEIIDGLIFEYLEDEDEGLYLLNFNRKDPRDIKLIVFNETRKEIIFLLSYQ